MIVNTDQDHSFGTVSSGMQIKGLENSKNLEIWQRCRANLLPSTKLAGAHLSQLNGNIPGQQINSLQMKEERKLK